MLNQTTTTSAALDYPFWFILWISLAILGGVTITMLYFVWRYSRAKNPQATSIDGNHMLELVWTIIPTILVGFMFYYGWAGFSLARRVPADAMVVKVFGQMWSWQFQYPNGRVESDLYVPVDRPVKLLMKSHDVNHSLFIAAFGLKEDVIPGRETYMWFEPRNVETYDIQCTEYCGTRHSAMISKLHVMPQQEFDTWYSIIQTSSSLSGEKLLKVKGCLSCHSLDGTPLVGPSLRGIYGRKEIVLSWNKEKSVSVDDEYLLRSLLQPDLEIVKGYPPGKMPSQEGLLSEEETAGILAHIQKIR